MRKFLADLIESLHSDALDRRQMIHKDEKDIERSQRPVRDIFMELRLNFDVTETVSRWDLIQFARLSGCEDLIEEAMLSAEEYSARIESRGGSYPLEGMRQTWAGSDARP